MLLYLVEKASSFNNFKKRQPLLHGKTSWKMSSKSEIVKIYTYTERIRTGSKNIRAVHKYTECLAGWNRTQQPGLDTGKIEHKSTICELPFYHKKFFLKNLTFQCYMSLTIQA